MKFVAKGTKTPRRTGKAQRGVKFECQIELNSPSGTWRMGRSAGLVLIGNVSGFSGVVGLQPFVSITLHLLVHLASGIELIASPVHALGGLLARCGLLLCRLLLRHCWKATALPAKTTIAKIGVRIALSSGHLPGR